mgnify:CR=1 FL=1
MNKETLIALAALIFAFAAAMPHHSIAGYPENTEGTILTQIAFGSCAHQDKEQPIWDAVLANNPDLFVFLGDNIYGDTENMDVLSEKYALLAAKPGFQALWDSTDVVATWDDHDYGENDAGEEYPMKEESKEIFLDFWGEPNGTDRRLRDDGVYTSYMYGPKGQRVQIILLDLRWARTPLVSVTAQEYALRDELYQMGPYSPNYDRDARMLSEAQWKWLEYELRKPADIRIIGTSLPYLMFFSGWETWANFPWEWVRMNDLITKTRAGGVVFISGDTHWSEFSRLDPEPSLAARGKDDDDHSRRHWDKTYPTPEDGVEPKDIPHIMHEVEKPYAYWDLTSSGLTEEWSIIPYNQNRLGDFYFKNNFGLIKINWDFEDPQISLEIRGLENQLIMQNTIRLSELQPMSNKHKSDDYKHDDD